MPYSNKFFELLNLKIFVLDKSLDQRPCGFVRNSYIFIILNEWNWIYHICQRLKKRGPTTRK